MLIKIFHFPEFKKKKIDAHASKNVTCAWNAVKKNNHAKFYLKICCHRHEKNICALGSRKFYLHSNKAQDLTAEQGQCFQGFISNSNINYMNWAVTKSSMQSNKF